MPGLDVGPNVGISYQEVDQLELDSWGDKVDQKYFPFFGISINIYSYIYIFTKNLQHFRSSIFSFILTSCNLLTSSYIGDPMS